MGVRDALLLNTTGSNFEALQSNETARIKGDFSIKNTSDTEVFGVDVSAAEVNITANITSSGDISGSETSTGSFGRVVASTFLGDGIEIRDSLTRSSGLVTASAQIASDISGAFDKGFFFGFQASSSISGGLGITGSFGRLEGVLFNGDGSNIKSTLPRSTGILSSSAQIAADISGSFNKGFEFEGTIKTATGGVFSTGASLGRTVRFLSGLGSVNAAHAIGGNAINTPQAFTEEYDGSSWSEGGELPAAKSLGGTAGTVNSGFLTGGFPTGTKSLEYNGSSWSETTDLPTTSNTGTIGAGTTSEAAVIGVGTSANQLNDWYTWNGSNFSEMTGLITNRGRNQGGGEYPAALVVGGDDTPTCISTNKTEIWDGSSWTEVAATSQGHRYNSFAGTTNDGIVMGALTTPGAQAELWDGTAWTETSALISTNGAHASAASGRVGVGTLAGGAHKFGGGVFSTPASELFGGFVSSGSFGRLDAITLSGDATALRSTLPYSSGLVTSSAQLSDDISGSFNKGFGFSGEISGSETSTGSFGRIVADTFHGDATPIRDTFPLDTGIVSGSAQLAPDISGSFNKGFGFASTSSLDSADGSILTASPGGTWSAGGNLTRSTYLAVGGMSGAGTKSAALIAGGRGVQHTEEYDGSSFTEKNNTGGIKNQSKMVGTTESSVIFGGATTAAVEGVVALTEDWNGTNWSEVNDLTQGRWRHGKLGISSNAAKALGGSWPGSPGGNTGVEDWNGTNWSNGTDLPAAINHIVSAGTYDSGIVQSYPTETYCWNGSSWSDVGTLPDPQRNNRPGGFGTSNDALIAGGQSPTTQYLACVNLFNGTAWSSGPNMPAGRNNLASVDSANTGTPAGMIAGGVHGTAPHYCAGALEYTGNTSALSVDGVFACKYGGDGSWIIPLFAEGLVTGSAQLASDISGSFNKGFTHDNQISGSLTSSGSFGQILSDDIRGDGSELTNVQIPSNLISGSITISGSISGSFNKGFGFEGEIKTAIGGVFSTGADLGRRTRFLGGLGSPSSALAIGGYNINTANNLTEEYDGSSWSEGGELPAAHAKMGTSGTVNAGFIAGGVPNGTVGNKALDYNGSSWSETTDLPATNLDHTIGAGVSANSAFIGITPSYSPVECRTGDWYVWNGSNWSEESANLNNSRYRANGGGESTEAALVTGGDAHVASCACSELWDGSSWSNTSALITGNRWGTFAGTTNDAIVIGGYPSVHPEDTAQLWDGITWTETSKLISGATYGGGGHGAAASGRVGVGTLAGGAHKFGGGVFSTPASELFTAFKTSASFHNIEVTSLSGDGSQFSASLQSQLLTSVSQISNSISGSFTSGFDLQGGVSASFGLFGDAWSIGGAVIDRSRHLTGFGTVDAAIKAGGANVNTTQATLNEEWNGALWSEIADMPAARKGGAGAGSANAGLYAGGDDSGYGGYSECSEVYIWNGLAWVETLDLPNGTDNALGHGFTQDSALVTHGAPQYQSNNADEWDGTTWTEKTANISSRGCGQGGGGANAAHIVGGLLNSPFAATTTKTECWNGSAWSEESNTTTAHFLGFYAGITNDAHVGLTWGPPNIVDKSTEIYNGISWAVTAPVISGTGDSAASGRTGVGTSQGGTHRFGGGVFGTPASELFNSSVSTGSLGQLRGTVGGEIKTDMFNITSSTFKLPLFSDADLNYWNKEPEESTGSISGSVVRVGDVNVLNKPGTFFFHSDYNALGFTYVSASVYSQSIDFRKCGYASGSFYTASSGFVTQSHYCYHNVIQYITGSYT